MSPWRKPLMIVALTLAAGLVPSVAFAQSDVELVESYYRRYLHRRPDPLGLRNNLYLLRNGATPQDIQAALLGSGDYYNLQGAQDDLWVMGLYEDVLGRRPTNREVDYWLDQLEQTLSRQATALQFLKRYGIR